MSCLNYGLARGYPVYLSTRHHSQKPTTAASKTSSKEIYERDFKTQYEPSA